MLIDSDLARSNESKVNRYIRRNKGARDPNGRNWKGNAAADDQTETSLTSYLIGDSGCICYPLSQVRRNSLNVSRRTNGRGADSG